MLRGKLKLKYYQSNSFFFFVTEGVYITYLFTFSDDEGASYKQSSGKQNCTSY